MPCENVKTDNRLYRSESLGLELCIIFQEANKLVEDLSLD